MKRLIKVAKELNVGTGTVVEYLREQGHDVDNKPTTKIDDEQFSLLKQKFASSLETKQAADKIELRQKAAAQAKPEASSRPTVVGGLAAAAAARDKAPAPAPKPAPKAEQAPPPAPAPKPAPAPVEAKQTPPAEKAPEAPKAAEAPAPKTTKPGEVEERQKFGLKVKGKIDLNPPKRKPKPAPKAEKAPEAPKVEAKAPETPKAEAPKAETPASATPEGKPAAEATGDPALMKRAEAPKLAGLKVLGKIDVKKFERPKRETGEDGKRKRTRKRVAVGGTPNRGGGGGGRGRGPGGGQNRGRGGARKDETKEVSKKEIEDKIKATMARLSGRGKNKRQKIRRDNRDRHRDNREREEANRDTSTLELTENISVTEFASLLDVEVTDVILTCMNLGVIVSINQRLDREVIELVAGEYEREVEFINADTGGEEEEEEIVDDPADLVSRAPIVTVMGHVDHGKTSLLDYVRKAKVADGEAGGITQHIGAYEVSVGEGDERRKITFLDTPGHEAFTAMRARGAKVTDIAIIIIAADDSIMPQTREAISHSQAAGVPIVIAINKIDKDGANPDRIKEELSQLNVLVEDWGGKVQCQAISAKTGEGIDDLLEKVVLEADILELKANPNRPAIGAVLEASLEKGRGYVARALVQTGTLRIGDAIVAGEASGKVKAMFNDHGKNVKEAGPATPVLVLGLSGAPQAGERFKVMPSETEARTIASKRAQIMREQTNRATKRISLDEIGRRLALGTFKELNLIVKGDVDGSVEALSDSLIKLSHETVAVNVIHKAVGPIAESDVLLASASDAIIIGFQVRPSLTARKLAEREGVEVKTYSIIYEVIDDVELAIEGMLEPTKEEKIVGQVIVRETYKISKIGTIAGCYVDSGRINRNDFIRVIRDGVVVYPLKEGQVGKIGSLKQFKDDKAEISAGRECGITIDGFNDIKVDDVFEAYEIIEIAQKLDRKKKSK
jgi:translation initiation factor IF-2